jgi:hypothetical protein
MWYFWFTFDKSSWGRKALWFLPLYFLVPLGPPLYFFFVYLRNPELISAIGGHATATSPQRSGERIQPTA